MTLKSLWVPAGQSAPITSLPMHALSQFLDLWVTRCSFSESVPPPHPLVTKIQGRKQFKGGKVYFGLQFGEVQSLLAWQAWAEPAGIG